MIIEVATNKNDSQKQRGDLLEEMARKFLESQNYEVEGEVNGVGMELDLLCKHKTNTSRKIYVECKAYNEENKIEAGVITKLVGTRDIEKYSEAWLIATSQLSKGAKGLVEKIENGEKSKCFTFYTPKKLIEAFVNSGIINGVAVAKKVFENIVEDKNNLGNITLLITEYGYFWAVQYLAGGKPNGIIFTYADNSEPVKEKELLDNLANLDTSFKELDFYQILNFVEQEEVKPKIISVADIKLNRKYISQINDMGIKLIHPNESTIVLSDVFIYPDLKNIENDEEEELKSQKLLNLDDELEKYIILGEDVSGKTSLAYTLQKNINDNKNIIPIYIKADKIKNSDFDKFSKLISKRFKEQYSKDQSYVEAFKRLLSEDRTKILIIIDDFEIFAIKRGKAKVAFFEMLEEKFKNVFIFANKSLEIEAMVKSETRNMFQGFKIFKIKQLGHVLRDELIEKWLTLEYGETITDGDLLDKKREIAEKIRIVTGINFIPTYPLYLLTILQMIEEDSKVKLQGSSYAELYRYLINQALESEGVKPEEWNFYHTYLSYVAHYLFINRKKGLSEEDMTKMYYKYLEEMDIQKSFNSVHDLLVNAKLFNNENNFFRFNHNYSYYFFVAKYIADNIEEVDVKEKLSKIIENLYCNEYANIIIFLIYHSDNKKIIDKIIGESSKLFSGIIPCTLSSNETDKINKLVQKELKISIEDKNPSDNRKKELELKDRIETENKEKDEGASDYNGGIKGLDLFGKINLSFKLMEILGQITIVYYGSLKGQQKREILMEVYSLGFKALWLLLKDFERYLETMKSEIINIIEKKGISSDAEKEKIINELVYDFTEVVTFVFIKRISDSIASKKIFTSIEKMVSESNTVAAEIMQMAIKLNFPNGLHINGIVDLDKKFNKNLLVKRLLRILVIEHLYKFDVKYSDKQRICAKLGIEIKNKEIIQKKLHDNLNSPKNSLDVIDIN